MNILSSLVGGGVATAVDAVGNAIDKIFTSDEEKAQAAIVMEKLRQHPGELQTEINKVEAQHRSIFVAGWRPAIGWVCALGLFYDFIIRPFLVVVHLSAPSLDSAALTGLVLALLGLGGFRTIEKFGNKTK